MSEVRPSVERTEFSAGIDSDLFRRVRAGECDCVTVVGPDADRILVGSMILLRELGEDWARTGRKLRRRVTGLERSHGKGVGRADARTVRVWLARFDPLAP